MKNPLPPDIVWERVPFFCESADRALSIGNQRKESGRYIR